MVNYNNLIEFSMDYEGLRLDEAMHNLTILAATGVYGKPTLLQNDCPGASWRWVASYLATR